MPCSFPLPLLPFIFLLHTARSCLGCPDTEQNPRDKKCCIFIFKNPEQGQIVPLFLLIFARENAEALLPIPSAFPLLRMMLQVKFHIWVLQTSICSALSWAAVNQGPGLLVRFTPDICQIIGTNAILLEQRLCRISQPGCKTALHFGERIYTLFDEKMTNDTLYECTCAVADSVNPIMEGQDLRPSKVIFIRIFFGKKKWDRLPRAIVALCPCQAWQTFPSTLEDYLITCAKIKALPAYLLILACTCRGSRL